MSCLLIGYRRVSTAKQGRSGLGLEAQDAAIAQHVRTTKCSLVATYTEVESGKKSDRPELAKAMEHARRIGATLVIAKLDRLSRNVHFLSGLMEAGVDFVCCDMPSANRMTIHIIAAVAEDEARRISERTKSALAMAKARGVKLGGIRSGQRPLTLEEATEGRSIGGAKAGKKRREEAISHFPYGLVEKMRAMRSEGNSLAYVAKAVSDLGYTTQTGLPVGPVQVRNALIRIDGKA